jgi:hypothetical protein
MVRTFSKYFPITHPKKGQPTHFVEKILDKTKIHTLRAGYSVKDGSILSPRVWSDQPYKSKQIQFMEDLPVGTQEFVIIVTKKHFEVYVKKEDGFLRLNEFTVAMNDGLFLSDFRAWFKTTVKGQIIHLTDFRY